MLTTDILDQNLNEKVSYEEYFEAFGYGLHETVYFRTFKDKKADGEQDHGMNNQMFLDHINGIISTLKRRNKEDCGVFYVVNGGGNADKDVKVARAQFIDMDDYSFPEQIERLNSFPLEPSVIVKTQKSLHAYWLLDPERSNLAEFRGLQIRLIQFFGSDKTIKNESRVMRLYGFEHRKKDPVMVTLIKFDPQIRYTQKQIHEALPTPEKKETKADPVEDTSNGDQANTFEWFKGFTKKHNIKILAQNEQHTSDKYDGALRLCVECPWKEEHTDEGPVEESKVFIYRNGALAYKCHHNHCAERGWKEYREFYEPPEEREDLPDVPTDLQDVLICGGKNKNIIKNLLANYVNILRLSPDLKGCIKYNLFTGNKEISGVSWDALPHVFNDTDAACLGDYLSAVYHIDSANQIWRAVDVVAMQNCYHPVRDVLNSLEWDGIERVKDLFPKYLGAERSEYTTYITSLIFQGIQQRVFSPGCKFDYCAVVKGKQGSGKSTLFRFMALRDEWHTEGLDDLEDSKKAGEIIQGKIIVELGEMVATQRTKTVEKIKSFITRQSDDYRGAWDRVSKRRLRQCIFVGTTNDAEFLPNDPTGNRRFLPVVCDGKPEVHPLDNEEETRHFVEQCHAEVMAKAKASGYNLRFDDLKFGAYIDSIREVSTPEDPKIAIIQQWLDVKAPDIVCTQMIVDYAIGSYPDKYNERIVPKIMNHKIKGWRPYRGKNGTGGKDTKYKFKDIKDPSGNEYRYSRYGQARAWERITEDEAEIERQKEEVEKRLAELHRRIGDAPENAPDETSDAPDDELLFT